MKRDSPDRDRTGQDEAQSVHVIDYRTQTHNRKHERQETGSSDCQQEVTWTESKQNQTKWLSCTSCFEGRGRGFFV